MQRLMSEVAFVIWCCTQSDNIQFGVDWIYYHCEMAVLDAFSSIRRNKSSGKNEWGVAGIGENMHKVLNTSLQPHLASQMCSSGVE